MCGQKLTGSQLDLSHRTKNRVMNKTVKTNNQDDQKKLFSHTAASRTNKTRMWANAQPDGRPAKHRWRPLFNAAKFG